MLEDWKIKTFLKICEKSSFTEAAKELNITQSAVSQIIGDIQKKLGVAFFTRTRTELYLTEAGKAFKDYAEKIMYWYDAINNVFSAKDINLFNREISIAADSFIASYILPYCLKICTVNRLGSPNSASFTVNPYNSYEDIEKNNLGIFYKFSNSAAELDENASLIAQTKAIVVTCNRKKAKNHIYDVFENETADELIVRSFKDLQKDTNIAVWRDFHPLLDCDIKSKVKIQSYSIPMIMNMIEDKEDWIALIPEVAYCNELYKTKFSPLPLSCPQLSMDIHFKVNEQKAGNVEESININTFAELLKLSIITYLKNY